MVRISDGQIQTATYTSNVNPTTCNRETGKRSFSQPRKRLTIQMARVLQVSVKLLAVALTCLVTLRPKKLKKAIEHATTIPLHSTAG